jgi:hypothetical protein
VEKNAKEVHSLALKKNLNDELLHNEKLNNKQLLGNKNSDPYASYYNNNNSNNGGSAQQNHDPSQFPDYDYAYNLYKESERKRMAEKKSAEEKPTAPKVVKAEEKQQQLKPKQSAGASNNSKKSTVASYKKFSIGNYAHLLNEPVVAPANRVDETESITGEQIIDKYYNTLKSKSDAAHIKEETSEKGKKENGSKSAATDLTSNDVDKIAANIASSGKAKWKNSGKQPAVSASSTSQTGRFFVKILFF